MEKVDRRIGFRTIVVAYIVIYIASSINHNFILTTVLKPGASLLVLYALKYILKYNPNYDKTFFMIKRAFFLWVLVDIGSTVSELVFHFNDLDFDLLFMIEALFYFIIRVMILIAVIQFYFTLTKEYNKFQKFADIFTIFNCIFFSLWAIFFAKHTTDLTQLFRPLNFTRIFSEIYKLVAMSTLGILLISWFHYQYRKITLGQRYILMAIALMSGMDLAVALYNPLMYKMVTDIIYKLSIVLFALGIEMFLLHPTRTLFIEPKNETQRLKAAWKNLIYLFSYPLFVVMNVGFVPELVMFGFLYAFYIIAFLYVKQLNITDQLFKSEAEKNKQLKLYSNVLEQAHLSIVITDIDGNIEYVNPYFTEITGYSFEEALGKNPRILKSDKTPNEVYEQLWGNLLKGKKWVGEFVNVNKFGNEYSERAIISPIIGDNEQISYYVGIKENITESQKMRNMIDNQSHFIVQLANVIPNAIFHVTKDDIFIEANSEFKKIYGLDTTLYNQIRLSDTPWMDADKYQEFIEMREESIRTRMPVIRQIIRNANGKETPVLYCINAYYNTDGKVGGYIGVMTDISQLKEKEIELQSALVRANAATEAKSLFLANMSHEIRTPMNAIIGMSYLALKTELTDKQRDYLLKISNAATSLLGIINDILDFSKIESGKVKMEKVEFDLDQVITKSIELLVQKAREKNLEVVYHLSCDIPKILKGDSLRLGQIITNLVSNAVKFTQKGEIGIDVIQEKRVGNYVFLKFCVKDTGIGISKENQKLLFNAFTQSDDSITRQYGGTGLGLAICCSLVEMMEGEIWIESELNAGSAFYFTAWFDIAEERNLKARLAVKDIQSIKTLIVDDNSAAREILKEYLENMGFVTEVAESGSQAIEMIQIKEREKEDPYQLLFVDWKMPHLDGVETVKKISEMDFLSHKPSVVLVTAYDTEEMKKLARDVQIDAFLSKPVSQSCLYDSIVNIFAESIIVNEDSVLLEQDYNIDGIHILLAEDNEVNQQIACELLEGQGCSIDVANNGLEAIAMYENNRDKYEMILMDIQMPEMDGFEATRKIREISKEIPIIAMTARSMQEEKEKCYKTGMNDHISKPIDPSILLSTIAKWRKDKSKKKQQVDLLKSVNKDNSEKVQDKANKIEYFNNIEGIDSSMGLIRVAGNTKLYTKLLRSFALEQQAVVKTIQEEYHNQNYEKLEKAVHLLKGVAGNIGANHIFDISGNIEKVLYDKRQIITIKPLIEMLVLEFEQISRAILRSLNESTEEISELVVTRNSKNNTTERILELMELLEKGDALAISYFEENKILLEGGVDKKQLERLGLLIQRYEFDEAIRVLSNIDEGE